MSDSKIDPLFAKHPEIVAREEQTRRFVDGLRAQTLSDLDALHHKENEIARLMTENLQLRNRLKNAWDVCPYDQDGCLLESSEIGPCLCVNPVASSVTSNHQTPKRE